MSESARKIAGPRMTVAAFLDWTGEGGGRYQLVDGQPMAMAPPSEAHGAIVMRLGFLLGERLKPPCRILAEAGIPKPGTDDTLYVADAVVTCAPLGPARPFPAAPVLIVEVLSPSTAAHDRLEKLPAYRMVPSLQEVLLLASTERRGELWRRAAEGWGVTDLLAIDAIVDLARLGIRFPLADLYATAGLAEAPGGPA